MYCDLKSGSGVCVVNCGYYRALSFDIEELDCRDLVVVHDVLCPRRSAKLLFEIPSLLPVSVCLPENNTRQLNIWTSF